MKIKIRTVAPSVGENKECTAVFVFLDGAAHLDCRKTHKYSAADSYWITIDGHFDGFTILRSPAPPGPTVE